MLVGENDGGLVLPGLGKIDETVGENNDDIAHLHLAGGRPIEANGARAALPPNGVGLEPLAVVHVHDGHLFVFHKVGGVHQVLVNGHAANVVQLGLRDRDPVNLGLHYFDVHSSD